MKLIAGLGNPGERYRLTRHNLGFMVIDHLAKLYEISVDRQGSEALYGKGKIEKEDVLLAKPQTFMNLSGRSIRKLLHCFHLSPEDLIVIHDDLDLPFCSLRVKKGGGIAGHRGLYSIVEEIKDQNFLRIRLGIGKPPDKRLTEDYVLAPFSPEEEGLLPEFLKTAGEALRDLLVLGLEVTKGKYHRKKMSTPPGEKET